MYADELSVYQLLSVEEIHNRWYFKDSIGNSIETDLNTIKEFVFEGLTLKMFGSIYHYPSYYPQNKPHTRDLECLRRKINTNGVRMSN